MAVLAFVAYGCDEGPTATGPSSNGVPIRGQVLDFSTQAGVSGVVVQIGETPATTDASGFYAMSMPVVRSISFTVSVDGVSVGTARVTGSTYRGDLLIDRGTCVSRYGTLADARTLRPVAGAAVSVGTGTATVPNSRTTVSGPDGWYRVDLGCPANGLAGFNTTLLYVAHPNYASRQEVVGRGVHGVRRLDLDLQRR